MNQAEFTGSKTHHDPCSPYYKYHVIRVGKANYCIGCFGTKTFLLLVLPILTFFFITRVTPMITTFYDSLIISFLLFPLALQFIYELVSNKSLYPKLTANAQSLYMLIMHLYIIFTPVSSALDNQKTIVLLAIMLLLTPQMMVYLYKITTCKEFTFRKSKIMVRLLFISAYFLTLLYAKMNLLGAFVLFCFVTLFFFKLRRMSSYRVEGDFTELKLYMAFNLHKQSLFNRFLQSTFLHFSNGQAEMQKSRSGKIYFFKTAMANFVVVLFFVVGIVTLSQNEGLSQPCQSVSAQETDTTTTNESCCNDEEGNCVCCYDEEGNCTCCEGCDCSCTNEQGDCVCLFTDSGKCLCFYDNNDSCHCTNDEGNCGCIFDDNNNCCCKGPIEDCGNCFSNKDNSCVCLNDEGNCDCLYDADNKCYCC